MRNVAKAILGIIVALGVVLACSATTVSASGVVCYDCECARCARYLAGYSCFYDVHGLGACDCELLGNCHYNPTYCDGCRLYPWAGSCQSVACGAAGQRACVAPEDLKGIRVIQEEDATSRRPARVTSAGRTPHVRRAALRIRTGQAS